MKLDFKNLHGKLGKGIIDGDVVVTNFKAPEIHSKLNTKVDLAFLSQFLNLEHFKDIRGNAEVEFFYEDIIDIENPQHALTDDLGNYKLKVIIDKMSMKTDYLNIPIKQFDFISTLENHQAQISKCNIKLGNSDIQIAGNIDDVPAIIHHTDIPVDIRLSITSKFLDLFELTGSNENAINEQIEDLRLKLDFKSSARAMTESKYLPIGEFFIEDFHAQLKHYPHELHDFHADIFVEEQDLRIVDFTGMIDKSDFKFTGKLEHYEKWFNEHPTGDSKIEFNFASKMLQLESVFSYKGEMYVPEEYRHEEFDNLKLHGFTYFHYADELKSIDLTIDHFDAKMKVHPLRFQNFKGRIHYDDDHLNIENFSGKLGHSSFNTTLHYYLGDNPSERKRENYLKLTASRLDIDQLIKYNPSPSTKTETVDHDAGFNIYELPFTDMKFILDVDHFNYHRYLFKNLKGELHTTPEHYLYIDQLSLNAAGGYFDVKGYFNGSNPNLIYFSPEMDVKNVDLDKLMYKFENFGQDHLVSENLHGKFSGHISGKIHMHNDLVPKLDDAEVHLDIDVSHGSLENYSLLHYMSDYFKDKNLDQVIFDTLSNHVDYVNGKMTIPKMTINSSLGHMEISGEQDLEGNMEYYIRIPWKMVTKTAGSKLFGKKDENDNPDEIIYGTDKTRYVNIKIVGNEDGYKFSLGKPKRNKKK